MIERKRWLPCTIVIRFCEEGAKIKDLTPGKVATVVLGAGNFTFNIIIAAILYCIFWSSAYFFFQSCQRLATSSSLLKMRIWIDFGFLLNSSNCMSNCALDICNCRYREEKRDKKSEELPFVMGNGKRCVLPPNFQFQ